MRRFLPLVLFFITSVTFSQVTTTIILDQNNVAAEISDGGIFFTSGGSSDPGYEVPAGSGINSMFALTYWFGGVDANGGLKMAIPLYGDQSDLFPGPLTVNTTTAANWPTSLFPVTRSEIENHIANVFTPSYIIPPSIANWPAHGDVSLGFDYYLAPFVDFDGDGNYLPSNGDYPCILGDKAVYVINNDMGDVHASGSYPLGIEVHTMFYQFDTLDYLNNATFAQVRLINRSTQTLYDYRMSVFADTDIGNYSDDYMGIDSVRNMMYAYNGDEFDEDFGEHSGYGNMPPAIGVKSLDHNFVNAQSYDGSMITPADYWNRMQDSTFIYTGNPSLLIGNSEESMSNIPGDRRMFYTIEPGFYAPWATHYHNYVVLFSGSDTSRLENVNQLYQMADDAQAFYDANLLGICVEEPFLSISETSATLFELFPNPSSGQFTIRLNETIAGAEITVSTLAGKTLLTQEVSSIENEVTLQLDAPAGIYLVRVHVGRSQSIQKLVLRNP